MRSPSRVHALNTSGAPSLGEAGRGEEVGEREAGHGVGSFCSAGDRGKVAYPGSDPIPPTPLCKFPSPSWGGVRGGGSPQGRCSAIPPSPTLPHVVSKTRLWHDGEGKPGIAALRRRMAQLERAHRGQAGHLSLGMPEVHAHLPGPGLACGVLHEIAASAYGDRPATFGFVFALMAAALRSRPASAVFVAQRRGLGDFGAPYGHGLVQLGLDVGRLLFVETESHKDALWAIEEALRSPARPAMVAGAVTGDLDLTASRRLNLAAALHATPLVLLRAPAAAGA